MVPQKGIMNHIKTFITTFPGTSKTGENKNIFSEIYLVLRKVIPNMCGWYHRYKISGYFKSDISQGNLFKTCSKTTCWYTCVRLSSWKRIQVGTTKQKHLSRLGISKFVKVQINGYKEI